MSKLGVDSFEVTGQVILKPGEMLHWLIREKKFITGSQDKDLFGVKFTHAGKEHEVSGVGELFVQRVLEILRTGENDGRSIAQDVENLRVDELSDLGTERGDDRTSEPEAEAAEIASAPRGPSRKSVKAVVSGAEYSPETGFDASRAK